MEEGVVDERRHAAEARAVALELVDLAGPVASPLSPSAARPTGLHVSFKVHDRILFIQEDHHMNQQHAW